MSFTIAWCIDEISGVCNTSSSSSPLAGMLQVHARVYITLHINYPNLDV